MGPRPGAVRSVFDVVDNEVKRDIETQKVIHQNDTRLWQIRRNPNSANVLNCHLIFVPVDSLKHREIWRRSSFGCKMKKFRTARRFREFWDDSPFGIGKWPHMLPVVPTRAYRKTSRFLTAFQLSRAFMKHNVKQEVKLEDPGGSAGVAKRILVAKRNQAISKWIPSRGIKLVSADVAKRILSRPIPQEDAPPTVAKTNPVKDWRAVDLEEDDIVWD